MPITSEFGTHRQDGLVEFGTCDQCDASVPASVKLNELSNITWEDLKKAIDRRKTSTARGNAFFIFPVAAATGFTKSRIMSRSTQPTLGCWYQRPPAESVNSEIRQRKPEKKAV